MSRPVYNPLIENANPSKNIGQKRNVTEIASNEILSISEHSQLTKNAESRWLPKTNAVSSKWHPNEQLFQVEARNGRISILRHEGA